MFQSSSHSIAVRHALPGRAGASTVQASDRRADGQERRISLSREFVRIDRSLQGIAMRLAVPVHAYRGVALSLLPGSDGALTYQINLLHRDAELSVTLDRAGDDHDILADWKLWSRFFRLPALVEREAGCLEEADATVGGLTVGKAATLRRAPRSRSKRRPLFLKRRKVGRAALTATSFAGEREIVART